MFYGKVCWGKGRDETTIVSLGGRCRSPTGRWHPTVRLDASVTAVAATVSRSNRYGGGGGGPFINPRLTYAPVHVIRGCVCLRPSNRWRHATCHPPRARHGHLRPTTGGPTPHATSGSFTVVDVVQCRAPRKVPPHKGTQTIVRNLSQNTPKIVFIYILSNKRDAMTFSRGRVLRMRLKF